MSHPIRKWLKDLLQYGRRSEVRAGDGKPPLLWIADLPRLGQMWFGHCWYRFWLDLRSIPPRVYFEPREVFSPHVRSIRSTELKPFRPYRALRAHLAAWGAMDVGAGIEALLVSLGRGTASIIGRTAGALTSGTVGLFGGTSAALAGIAGLAAVGTWMGLTSISRSTSRVGGSVGRSATAVRDGFTEGVGVLAMGLRSPREIAWTFATLTGTAGLILLTVLQSIGVTAVPKTADEPQPVVHSPTVPVQAVEVAQADVDPFGGLPDPFNEAPSGLSEAPRQSEPEPVAVADLQLDVGRVSLPVGVARFNLPNDDESFLVDSSPAPTTNIIGDDDWLTATRPRVVERPPIVPAAYREMADDVNRLDEQLPQPGENASRRLPSSEAVKVSISKSQPTEATPGILLWYDLIVTNDSDAPVPAVTVEERVSAPHRVADARPAASFNNGALSWRVADLKAHEERRLSVAVYPMSDDSIETSSTIRPSAAISSVTLVQAETPAESLPPIVRPEPMDSFEPEEPPQSQPEEPSGDLRRIKMAITIPERVSEGSACEIRFAVTNTGGVPLTDVELQGVLSPTLRHPEGNILETAIGELAPGETKQKTLHLTAAAIGEADLFAEVTTAEGVGTNVRGLFSIVDAESAATDSMSCCEPLWR